MKQLLFLFILASLAATTFAIPQNVQERQSQFGDVFADFQRFTKEYDRQYVDINQYSTAFEAFYENWLFVNTHNSNPYRTYTVKLNNFADVRPSDFSSRVNGVVDEQHTYNSNTLDHELTNSSLPKSVDWREHGLVTGVKNQGQCGSCWAFSAVASLEGQHAKKNGKLVSLSEQNLVDCSKRFGNYGCGGGLMANALEYVKYNGGIDTEQSYPYVGMDEMCEFKKTHVGATVRNVVNISRGDVSGLMDALAHVGPISVAIDATDPGFQFYHDGVYTSSSCSQTQLDHGVTAVGYGVWKDTIKYYIVKNSWGEDWGKDGYILLNRDKNRGNMCGIATAASYPLV